MQMREKQTQRNVASRPSRPCAKAKKLSGWLALIMALASIVSSTAVADEPEPTRALRELNKSYFPFTPVKNGAEWKSRHEEIQRRVLVASGLYPMPEKTPLNAVIHGRIEKDDYTVEKVSFESLPGHFVTGNLYLPKQIKGKIPAVICPHGHWPNGRFMNADAAEVKKQIAMGAEKFESAAHSPLQARCVQLARMGCAVFFYDMLGYADSVQFPEHRHGPAAKGFVSPEAELNLVSYFGLQTWNSERVLDFISRLPYVDPTRIGCTGASGGGTQTMMITGIDDRIAAAFPCVMVSTAMQGGCTCENAHYLRINQGNIDIAALTAPRPLGMTAADDWTKELEAKGFPDLKNLYALLGVPDRVEAHFNIQFPHNYNAVSRAQMYAFFNQYFKLGLTNTDERDFQLLSTPELNVWDDQHPKPTGDQVGVPHEIAVVNWFKQQTANQMEPLLHPKSKADLRRTREVLGGALEVMIGRALPKPGESTFNLRSQEDKGDYLLQRGSTTCDSNVIETTFLYPKKWNHDTILWLTLKGEESLIHPDGKLSESAAQMLEHGYAISCPQLYLLGATRNPNVYAADKRKSGGAYEGFAGYHYGYNPSLFAERVRDALALIGEIRDDKKRRVDQILVAGVEGAGVIAAAATALAPTAVHQLACDTQGFRFAQLDNAWDVNFVPGGAKYGDVPALLALCAPVTTTVVGETRGSAVGVASAFAVAKGRLDFVGVTPSTAVEAVVNALTGRR
jgi:dienelactone hydrolase